MRAIGADRNEEATHGQKIATVRLDIRTRVLQVYGADAEDRRVLHGKLRREEVRAFLAPLPPCRVGMEACATAHHWARELRTLGHDARLIPPAYMKPYVVRQKPTPRTRRRSARR